MNVQKTIVGGQRNNYEFLSEGMDVGGKFCWVFYPIVGNDNKKQKIFRIGETWEGRLGELKKVDSTASWKFHEGGKEYSDMPIYRRAVTLIRRIDV